MPAIFNSRDEAYKTPFGTAAAGQEVCFTLRVPPDYSCHTPFLFIWQDGEENAQQLPFAPVGQEDGRDVFRLTYTPAAPGLYFYYFDLWVHYRKLFCGPGGAALETTGEGSPYQLTVFNPAFATPKTAKGGVMYQIFPDRFCEGVPGIPAHFSDRIYREDKTKEPYFWPGNIENGYLTRDYFGGDLEGIRQKLPYLASLGVTLLYLNPIFEAHSNHRYNTANYMNVDPDLGTNADFARLCKQAKKAGIRVILDGVFSHTGSDSIYFNKEGRYPAPGAWQSKNSPYRPWYCFKPDGSYESWWGFATLPACDKQNPDFRRFICGKGGVIDTWLQRGAGGFRLDVADELPDDFIAEIRAAVKRNGEENLLIGEVWEDASHKIAYGLRRRYFCGDELDGVMNYPFRSAILRFANDLDAAALAESVLSICENYPPPALHCCTTHLSTHDTERAITALAGEPVEGHDRSWQSGRFLSSSQYEYGITRLRLALVLQFVLPGIPCVYYGDEIAMQGYKDPFNRGFYNWQSGETRLKELIVQLAALRKSCPAFAEGRLHILRAEGRLLVLRRQGGGQTADIALNAGELPAAVTLLGQETELAPMDFVWRTGKD